jgi:hypothetical protein
MIFFYINILKNCYKKSQNFFRSGSLNKFVSGERKILIATDVASRSQQNLFFFFVNIFFFFPIITED